MSENTSIIRRENGQMEYAMSVEGVMAQVHAIQDLMKQAMIKDEHYGIIPGCVKPSLLKPGAEKLSMMFRLAPYYEITEKELPGNHREYSVTCTLKHIVTGQVWGQGVGSCSTMETKFRYRKAEQTCPKCGKPTIIKGKKEYGGGWLCFPKKGGCGAKFQDGDKDIENQNMGRVEHDNPADYHNTCLKMGKKRAHVDSVLTATAASDIFTQDVEEMVDNGVIDVPASPKANIPPPPIKSDPVQSLKDKIKENSPETEPAYPDHDSEPDNLPPIVYDENSIDGLKNKIRDNAATHFPNPPSFNLWLKTLTTNEEKGFRGLDGIDQCRSFNQARFIWGALKRKMEGVK